MKKFMLYVEDNWNKCDMVAIFLFIAGVTCRSGGPEAWQGAALGGWWAGLPPGWVRPGLAPVLCILEEAPALSGHGGHPA